MLEIINYINIFFVNDFKVVFNFIVLAVLIYSWVISRQSENIRWLLGVVVLSQAVAIIILPWIKEWGFGFYIVISIVDLSDIYFITQRKAVTLFFAGKNWPVISSFSRRAVDNYKLTSNEIAVIFISVFSILANILNFAERLIRHNTDYNPMFIYNCWAPFKFALSILMLFVLVSVAIDAKRGYYNDNQGK